MGHTRGKPHHPKTQGKIGAMAPDAQTRILPENYYLPGELEAQIGDFVASYNHLRYHESIANLTPAEGQLTKQPEDVDLTGLLRAVRNSSAKIRQNEAQSVPT